MIAFTKMYMGNFHIGVMRKDGSQERLLTKALLMKVLLGLQTEEF